MSQNKEIINIEVNDLLIIEGRLYQLQKSKWKNARKEGERVMLKLMENYLNNKKLKRRYKNDLHSKD